MNTPNKIFSLFTESSFTKAKNSGTSLFFLSILAGCFIACGAIFFTSIISRSDGSGIYAVLGGTCFSLGLILVIIGGAELFTGNNLMMIGLLQKRITLLGLIRNWVIVYIGNLLGSLVIVFIMYIALNDSPTDQAFSLKAQAIADYKLGLSFQSALAKAILCNILVCLAVWLSQASKEIVGKIILIIFPITAFVAIGFEHSVANMYFIPMGLLLKGTFHHEIGNFLINNLLPVTIGNVIGGSFFIGGFYWFSFRK